MQTSRIQRQVLAEFCATECAEWSLWCYGRCVYPLAICCHMYVPLQRESVRHPDMIKVSRIECRCAESVFI